MGAAVTAYVPFHPLHYSAGRVIGGFFERTALRDWRAVAGLFFTAFVLESVALGHVEAFTPLFLSHELGLPPEQVAPWTGILSAASFAVAFPLAPLWGPLAERYSRKLIIVRSQYLEALTYAMCAFAPDLTWFLVARLLMGFTFGNIAVIIATQSLLTPERRVASAISIVQAGSPIAVSLGPPLGALVLPWIGLRGLFMLDAVLSLVAALLVTFLMPEPPDRRTGQGLMRSMATSLDTAWRRPVIRWNFVAWFLTRGTTQVAASYLPVRIAELAPGNPAMAIGIILGVFGLLTTVLTWTTGRIVDRVGPARIFWPAMVIGAVATAATAFVPWLWLLALFAWVRALPVALTNTVLYAHLTHVLRRDERSAVMSLTPFPRNMASFVVPLVAAAASTFGAPAALYVAAASYGLAAWVGRLLQKATPPRDFEENKEREAPA